MVINSFPTIQVTEFYSFYIQTHIVLDLYGFEPANPTPPPTQRYNIGVWSVIHIIRMHIISVKLLLSQFIKARYFGSDVTARDGICHEMTENMYEWLIFVIVERKTIRLFPMNASAGYTP